MASRLHLGVEKQIKFTYMSDNNLHPLFDQLINAGLGLRLFQAFSRSIPEPTPTSYRAYIFFFHFIQNLADNKDRISEVPKT